MAVNYVKGQILSGVLERDGIDISIANANVGINTNSPTVALDVNGNIQANNFNTTGAPNTGNITGANVISSVTLCAFGSVLTGNILIPAVGNISVGNVNINNLTNPVANQDAATKYYVDQSIGNRAVTNQILNGDGSTITFILDRSTTTAAVLIMLNGITQVPGQSYDMVPSPSANLVFSEAPGTGDLIDIRFL
jgi:hypothetical protein